MRNMKILGISGRLRRQSYNRALLRASGVLSAVVFEDAVLSVPGVTKKIDDSGKLTDPKPEKPWKTAILP